MKKLLFLSFSIFMLFAWNTDAQNESDPCGYVPDQQYFMLWKNPKSIQNKRLEFLKNFSFWEVYQIPSLEYKNEKFQLPKSITFQGEDVAEENRLVITRVIPIIAHIIRRTDGTGGLSNANLNAAIETANGFYNNFHFKLIVCETRFINSDAIFNNAFLSEDDNTGNSNASFNVLDVTRRNVARYLNIYFVPSSDASWTWRPNNNNRKQHILMLNSQAINGTTVSHEIGHWFDLLHTHDGGDELVDGTNCTTAGDFVCDTPADPNLSGNVNASCVYIGTRIDANGDKYNPDTRNLLSYAGRCRNRFSDGQIYRMQSALFGMQDDRGYTFTTCSNWTRLATNDPEYSDGSGWNDVNYYSTIQTAVVNNELYLLARANAGIHLNKFNAATNSWVRLATNDPNYSDGSGWNDVTNYSTIQTAVVNNELYLLARANAGIHLNKYKGQ